ncbi:hypothetical protein E2562_005930 [Oryza meyeriana var. granulata]|uniref:Uncharacterized protein n=1 Tax=Oryza meyeriana var. granulata TaxID=110450 RepID=A0A6G1DVA4_9ORYZ|nr:hypothetical protein E2562_005930 [Oryza meyeriana var. granulata]
MKSGWDVVNLCLVVFAILCGLLGRGSDGESSGAAAAPAAAAAKGGKSSHQVMPPSSAASAAEAVGEEPSVAEVWASLNTSVTATYANNHYGHTGIRRLKSSSSYPELRLDSDGVWGHASPEAAWRTVPEVKTIPVDTYEVRRKSLPKEERRRRRSIERLPSMAEIVEEERPQPQPQQPVETETRVVETVMPPPLTRSRRWNSEMLDAVLEQETRVEETVMPTPLARSRTWNPEMLEAVLEQEMRVEATPPPPLQRRRSVESLPRTEELEAEIRWRRQGPRLRHCYVLPEEAQEH